jgi:hypothetical protein
MTAAQWYILAATMGTIYAALTYLAHAHKRAQENRPWIFYNAHFTGEPRAVCQTCGQTYVYWEAEDLDAHTQWHYEQDTAH